MREGVCSARRGNPFQNQGWGLGLEQQSRWFDNWWWANGRPTTYCDVSLPFGMSSSVKVSACLVVICSTTSCSSSGVRVAGTCASWLKLKNNSLCFGDVLSNSKIDMWAATEMTEKIILRLCGYLFRLIGNRFFLILGLRNQPLGQVVHRSFPSWWQGWFRDQLLAITGAIVASFGSGGCFLRTIVVDLLDGPRLWVERDFSVEDSTISIRLPFFGWGGTHAWDEEVPESSVGESSISIGFLRRAIGGVAFSRHTSRDISFDWFRKQQMKVDWSY